MEKQLSNPEILLNGFDAQIMALGVGSAEFQIAKFTQRIKHLTFHLSTNKKDNACKFGLIKLVSKRSKMLKHVKSDSVERYKAIISYLGLRK